MKSIKTTLLSAFLALFFSSSLSAQTKPVTSDKPALVVGIVVDQMRWDYLYRYPEKYSANGFNRLLREGYSCQNTQINYSPSYTACGHTCVYTGSVPAVHGITGNNWFDYDEKKVVYCTQDTTFNSIGSTSKAGRMSPNRMLTTTITDELRLATNFGSKTIGVALKDRGSILPAGHSANAAYFYDGSVGNFITSSYYMKELPSWVNEFNRKQLPELYIRQNWNTLLPIAQYFESHEDDAPFEETFSNEKKPIFEHRVSELMKPGYDIIKATPYGNTYTLDFAKATIAGEKLGKGKYTDFLAVSLSSTDYIGHQFGPNSVEIEDCYIRLDKELEQFFNYLDANIGKGKYLLFLTADHGAAHVPDFLKRNKIPAGVFPIDTVYKQLETHLASKFGEGKWLLGYENMQFSLNRELIAKQEKDLTDVIDEVKNFIAPLPGVAKVLDLTELEEEIYEQNLKQKIANSYYPRRAGDVFVIFEPGWFEGMEKGTTHGTIYPYDTHIPLVFMGWNVKPGLDYSQVNMTDIAPTLAAMLRIQVSNGSVGKIIPGLFVK
jgi:arylsulfatase A-like enzyme